MIGTFDCTPKVCKKTPSTEKFHGFVTQSQHKVPIGKRCLPPIIVDVTQEPYIMAEGYLYCNCCKLTIGWDNRSKHIVAKKHKMARQNVLDVMTDDLNESRPLAQQRIQREGLLGSTYGKT